MSPRRVTTLTELEQVDTYSPEQTEAFGEHLAGAYPGCRVLALLGGLGAGKTALVRGLARGLGCRDAVASPTYAIVNEYRGEHPLYHFDMYRITDSDALYDIGWEDYLAREGLCAVEWSENILDALPPGTLYVKLDKRSETHRHITVYREEGTTCAY